MNAGAHDADGQPFWESCKTGAMALEQCTKCRRFRYPPRSVCPYCLNENAVWTPVAGTGYVYVALVVHPRQSQPFSLVVVELDEGVRMWSNVVGCDPNEVQIGQRLQICYEETAAGTLPRFERKT